MAVEGSIRTEVSIMAERFVEDICAPAGCQFAGRTDEGSPVCKVREPGHVVAAFQSGGCDISRVGEVYGTLMPDGTFIPLQQG